MWNPHAFPCFVRRNACIETLICNIVTLFLKQGNLGNPLGSKTIACGEIQSTVSRCFFVVTRRLCRLSRCFRHNTSSYIHRNVPFTLETPCSAYRWERSAWSGRHPCSKKRKLDLRPTLALKYLEVLRRALPAEPMGDSGTRKIAPGRTDVATACPGGCGPSTRNGGRRTARRYEYFYICMCLAGRQNNSSGI